MQLPVQLVRAAWERGQLADSYLCPVRRGTDRRRYGKVLVSQALCGNDETCKERILRDVHPDLHFVTPSGQAVGIDQIRDLKSEASYSPVEENWKIYLFPEAERLSTPAANSLLKILEDPPEFVHFFLFAEDPSRLPPTVLSRCQRLPVGGLSGKDLKEWAIEQGLTEAEASYLISVVNNRADLLRDAVEQYSDPLGEKEEISDQFEELDPSALGEALADSTDLLEIHEGARHFYRSLPDLSDFDLLQVAEELSQADRERVGFVLQKGALIYRNSLLQGFQSDPPKEDDRAPSIAVSPSSVRSINRALVDLDNNSNLQLLLESLLFRLADRKVCKPEPEFRR